MPLLPDNRSPIAGRAVQLHVAGAIDVHTAPGQLHRILLEGGAACNCVELDLGGVEFIDSSGISMLITAKNEFDRVGLELVVVNPSIPVTRLLTLTGLTETFGVVDTLSERSATDFDG
jgi:anti-sigma B factor antagonist